ncbi:MAG TPA: MarR family transcriptional regulator [Gaiellaceae bacterium]|jgi:DNA-binding MarR family transcriptional regulator|nr:MarR family transcriptional regulator [Gaiellaceae bacterium]
MRTTLSAAGDAAGLPALADELLATMASIRRSGRLSAGRPVELSALTGSQVDLVRLVRRRPGISVTEAAEELRLAANTVSTLVRQLTDAGLLIRSANDSDRRVARLELTAGMKRKADAFRDRRVALLSAAMAQLSLADQRRLAGALEVLGRLAGRLPDREAAHE